MKKSAKRSVSKRKSSSSSLKRAASDNTRSAKPVPRVTLLPDSSTDALKTLSKMRFLADEPSFLDQRVQPSSKQEKQAKLAAEYSEKQQKMKDNINKQLSMGGRIVNMEIPIKQGAKAQDYTDSNKVKTKLADGFVRSERSQAMRVRDTIDQEIDDLKHGRDDLIFNLNKKMLKLDELNSQKKIMHEKLAEQIQFVRDLQKALGGASIGDLNSLVATEVREAYNQEKEQHKRLEDQLLSADAELSNIREKIRLLAGEKREVIVIQNGQKKSFKVTSKNIESVSLQIKHFQNQILHQDQAIAFVRDVNARMAHEITGIERQISHLKAENNMLLQKTYDIECKNDNAVVCLGNETARTNKVHYAHQKLLSIRLLEGILSVQVSASQRRVFQQIWRVQKEEQTVMLIGVAMKKLFEATYLRQLRAAVQLWFRKGFTPMKVKKQEKGLDNLLQFIGSKDIDESKWAVDQDSLTISLAKYIQGLSKLCSTVDRVQRKLKAWSFKVWQKRSHSKCLLPDRNLQPNFRFSLERLRRNIQKYHWQSVSQSFNKWRAEATGRLSQFRLLALAKSFAVLQINCRLFTAWKIRTSQLKLKKRSLLMRAFKNLKTNLRRNGSYTTNKVLVSTMQIGANFSILEACFDSFSYYCRKKQLKRNILLSQKIQPQISDLKREIKERKDQMERKAKIRAIHVLAITPFSKQLKQVLNRWSTNCSGRAREVRLNFKYLLIKTYKAKLLAAFNGFKAGLIFRQRSRQHTNIDSIHDQNYQMDHDRLQLSRANMISADNVRQQGLKQFRELCIKAAQRNMSQWMYKWLSGANLKSKQLAAAELMLRKMRKRILTTALHNFKRGFNLYLQDQYNFRRAHEIKCRLAFRIKKRVYMAIAQYSNRHNTQVLALRYLLKTIHRHSLVKAMLTWQKFSLRTNESNLLNQEKFEVVIMDRLQNELSQISGVKNESDITNKRFKGVLITSASQTLKKWVIRSHLGGQQYGFVTWKQKANKLRHRQILVKYLSRSVEANMQKTVLFRWKQTLILDNRNRVLLQINQKAIAIGNHEQKIDFNRQEAEKGLCQINASRNNVKSEAALLTQKATKVVTELIRRRQDNIFLSRMRFMFQQWRLYSHNQYKCVVALERGISKMCLQRAFLQIRDFHQQEYRNEVLHSHLKNLFRLKLLLPAREALCRWRTQLFLHTNDVIQHTTELRTEENQRQLIRVEQIRQTQQSLSGRRKQQSLTLQTFKHWKQCSQLGKMQRAKIQATRQILTTFELLGAIRKLKLRASLTAKYKAKLALFARKRREIYIKACFVKSLKYMYELDKRMARGAAQLSNSIVFSNCLLAFQRIRQHSKIRYGACCSKKKQASRQLGKVLDRLRSQKLRHVLRLISSNSHFNLTLYQKLKQCLNNRSSINARSYFDQWRFNSLKQGVVDYNNSEDGPVNIETWHERMTCRNLVQMMQEDGHPDSSVQTFLQTQSDKFYELGEKTVCRMTVCLDENIRLLPIAIDRLRTYARLRKIWREKLKYVNGLLEFDRHNIYLRFQRWKNFDHKMRQKLQGTPLKQLQITEDTNRNRLLHLADEVNYNERAILEFKEQKGVLFKCFIGSQRLALSSTKASYERVQQKAILRFSDHGNQKLQNEIGCAIDRNLTLIQQLKERIHIIEQDNHRVSEQNDEFRFQAVQAVHNAHQVQILKQDNESLQYEVANAARAFKNLMADNQLLSRHLQEHRIEAKIQLQQSEILQNQKLAELDQLRQEERQSSGQRRGTSLNTQYKQSVNREPTRSLSPVLQDHSISVSNKSPLRLRHSLPPQHI